MVSKYKVNPRIEERMKELFYGSLADLKKKNEENSHNFWYAVESSTVTWQHGDWGARRRQINQEHREFQEKHIV